MNNACRPFAVPFNTINRLDMKCRLSRKWCVFRSMKCARSLCVDCRRELWNELARLEWFDYFLLVSIFGLAAMIASVVSFNFWMAYPFDHLIDTCQFWWIEATIHSERNIDGSSIECNFTCQKMKRNRLRWNAQLLSIIICQMKHGDWTRNVIRKQNARKFLCSP